MLRLATIPTALALGLAAAAASAGAQQAPTSAAVGHRVRIVTRARDVLIGELRAVAGDTIVLRVTGRGRLGETQLTVPPSEVEALYVSRRPGARGARALRAAAIGAGIAGAVGLVLGAGCGECGEGAEMDVMLAFAPVGAVVGGLLGAIAGGERWEQVPRRSGAAQGR